MNESVRETKNWRMKIVFATIIVLLFAACERQQTKEIVNDIQDSLKVESVVETVDNSVDVSEEDTINVGAHKLIFQTTDSTSLTQVFDDLQIRRQMTDTIDNWLEKNKQLEKYLATKYPNYFKTDEKELTLFLEGGKELTLPKWDSLHQEGYNFGMYLAAIDYYLVYVQWYEGGSILLVNRKNGFKRNVIGEPYFSPDTKKMLTINSDLYAGYTDNGIEVLSITGDTLKSEFKILIKNWGPTGARWLTDKKIVLQKEYFDPKVGKKYSTLTID
jgi:hypothetical protein